jgi:DNA (cytosine-5)-methyltransferase 1
MRKKPAYQLPAMRAVARVPSNGYQVVSTFSGAGGSSLGYRMAGFDVIWANEFIPAAQEVYRANHPTTLLDESDIRTLRAEDILKATGLLVGELDLFDGSPPCASFSMAGRREKEWGQSKRYSGTEQRTDDLFFEYSRLLRDLQPKTFVAENVSGLVKGTAKGYFKIILEELRACGYRVEARLLDSQWLGVPQTRQRLIFVGVRNDLKLNPVHPAPLPYRYSLRDAFSGADELPGQALTMRRGKMLALWRWTVQHGKMDFSDAHKAMWGNESSFNHRRCVFHLPAPTIVQGSHCLYHPDQPRTLSIPEIKRISSFPDDFILTGNFAQQWERVGRAVPPVMMRHVAETIRREVLDRL